MTNKENILQTALRLFAENGFDRTPTSQIAREAGVSEGLIFRHYGNKAGLLGAIIQRGSEQVEVSMQPYRRGADPLEAIVQHIRESFRLLRENTPFWRLVHALRHQASVQQNAENQLDAFKQSVVIQLAMPFRLLGARQPVEEALLLFALIDGITAQYVQIPEAYPLEVMEEFIINKYKHGNFSGQP
ncbi:MAG: TetR/AcrR family transcriptional regulator [Lewinellaceae bacterium]|nr:TetR/AcrR family transcriptional regulator [Lewinellaceae bacterium]